MEVFTNANALSGAHTPLYEPVVIAPTRAPFVADSRLTFQPDAAFDDAGDFDTLITPGGPGLRDEPLNGAVAAFLRAKAPHTRRMASVCTGLYGLAATGLLNGRRAATHWRYAADAAKRFPRVSIDANVLYLVDPPYYTSAGIAAGIDLALALVEEDHGAALALNVAREMVVYFKRPGGQLQFSEPLRFQTRAIDRFAELAAWLPGHLEGDLSITALAARSNMSPRHFSRLFKETFGLTSGDYVEALRLDTARLRLGAANQTVESVAYSVGFKSSDVFRRAFERRFGVTPSAYCRHFAPETSANDAALSAH
jgi:transcriptional regulator GlxA family with amidase domain